MDKYQEKLVQNIVLKDRQSTDHIEVIHEILTKPQCDRTTMEVYLLGNLVKDIPFFKNKKELTRADIFEIANAFKFQKDVPLTEVITYGTTGKHFYIILQGCVSVLIPNNQINNWEKMRRHYRHLKQWKDTEYVNLVSKAKNKFNDDLQHEQNLKRKTFKFNQ
jgi:hypothetical protein